MGSRTHNRKSARTTSAYNGAFQNSSAGTNDRTVTKASSNAVRPARMNEHVSLSNRFKTISSVNMPSNYRKSAYKNPIFPKTNKAERMQLSGAITKMTGIEVPADVRRNRGARFATEAMQTSNSEDATGNSSNQTAAKAKGAGRRGSGRRGGRGGARERGNRKPLTKESLDSELDGYMMKDSTTGKNILDKELDAYMQDITPNAGADL